MEVLQYFMIYIKFILLFSFIFFQNCRSKDKSTIDTTLSTLPEMRDNQAYKKSPNPSHTLILNYTITESVKSPVKMITYYVTDVNSNKVIYSKKEVAAERISWKDDQTLMIVPYIGMVKKTEEVGQEDESTTILIKIK